LDRSDFKRDGSGRGNWGTPGEEIAAYVIVYGLLHLFKKVCINVIVIGNLD